MAKKPIATKLPEHIEIEVEGHTRRVLTADYVKAKTKQLRQFGYGSLAEASVMSELGNLLAGKKLGVIGQFMQGEVVT